MSRLLKRYDQELSAGLTPDLPNKVSPFFRYGRNVNFKDGGVQPASGQTRITSVPETEPVTGMRSALINGAPQLFLGNLEKLYTFDGSTVTQKGSGFSGIADASVTQRATLWSFAPWGQWMVATNGQDPIQLSKDGAAFSPLSGSPPATAEVVVSRSPFMFAFNTDRGGNAIEWCDEGDVETWDATQSNLAGALFPVDLPSDFIAGLNFQGTVFGLTASTLHAISFFGPPNVFGEELALEGIGVYGKHAVTLSDRAMYGMGRRGIWRSDGTSYEYADSPELREFVYDDLNKDQASKIVAWYNPFDQIVVFFYPTRDSKQNNRAVAFDFTQKNWTVYSFGRSAADPSDTFDFALNADDRGRVYFTDVTTTAFAVNTGSLFLDEDIVVKTGYGVGGYGLGTYGGKWNG
jgi:hypothetical protein